MSPSFWSGKRVLVTGHTGFKGAWLVAWLRALGANVTGLSLAPATVPNLWDLLAFEDVTSLEIDINDAKAVERAMSDASPDVVFHLAAQALVRRSYSDPAESFATNVIGTINVLNAIRNVPSVKSVVSATSDKCYHNNEQIWGFRETDPMGGHDPYSASKGAAEIAIASMRHSYFQPFAEKGHDAKIAAVRAGNVIGGGDWAEDRLVPDIVRGCLGDEGKVTLRAPNSVRPWQHVLEPLRGYMMLAEKMYQGADLAEGWNFGPERSDERAVFEVANAVVNALGTGEVVVAEDAANLHEAKLLRLDCTKARSVLGWVPAMTFEDCIKFTAEWYAGWAAGAPAHTLCETQINDYTELLGDASE